MTRLAQAAAAAALIVCATAQSPPAPAPLSTPAITGPLQQQPPAVFDAGPLGNLDVNAIVSGMGLVQTNAVSGDETARAALSNGQIFIQKTDGWLQFYLQVGAYDLPALGTPFLQTDKTLSDFFGPVPVAFLKLAPAKNTSILIGSLPTLIGAEYTFTFENMNIERGLLWNQENAVNRGIQLNQAFGKLSASLSWNDGFYSNRYTWLTGSLTWTSGPHTLVFDAGGNYGQTRFQTLATPVQNNGSIFNVIYTYTKGPWIVQPYVQFTDIPTNAGAGIGKGASTAGGAVLASYTFPHGFSLTGRWEYIASTGSNPEASINLMYGPGSAATSVTLTPTWQKGGFFVRGDVSLVHALDFTAGSAFGRAGTGANQTRAVAEAGFIFGGNLVHRK
ncbi:MAG TPA: outer membrane beta-barrel protein [Bryobacteraceae bacterium]|nr:outer membrane beta-barrel protein [Bryobacteraceae bacterium]